MNTPNQLLSLLLILGAWSGAIVVSVSGERAASIPLDQIGATAGKQSSSDGLSVCATEAGARLQCVFQRMEGEVTCEGLWLTSTVTNTVNDRFRVTAASLERTAREPAFLSPTGKVEVTGKVVQFIRPGLIEEYSVSMDGVRQDFLIQRRPKGEGELRLELAVTGARVERSASGARLVLDGSGRKIAYGRLRVRDATGKELNARMEVLDGARRSRRFDATNAAGSGDNSDALEVSTVKRPEGRAPMLAVLVNDADAVYPVRIDPTSATITGAAWVAFRELTARFTRRWWMVRAISTSAATSPS